MIVNVLKKGAVLCVVNSELVDLELQKLKDLDNLCDDVSKRI